MDGTLRRGTDRVTLLNPTDEFFVGDQVHSTILEDVHDTVSFATAATPYDIHPASTQHFSLLSSIVHVLNLTFQDRRFRCYAIRKVHIF